VRKSDNYTVQNLKDELLQRLLRLQTKAYQGDVGLDCTGEFNLVLVIANDQLHCDLRDLSVKEGERNIALFRHADDPVTHRPITAEEKDRCLMSGDTFRARLEEAIARLAPFVPPKDSIGFVR
jgi:hypothetical protein